MAHARLYVGLTLLLQWRLCSTRASACVAPCSADPYYPHGLQTLSKGTTIRDTLRRLGSFEEVPQIGSSAFVKPKSLLYELDGKTRRWDAIESFGSVGAVLFHTELRAFLIVRQFRPAVYACLLRAVKADAGGGDGGGNAARPDMASAFTFELCAGILDKAKSLEEIVSEEIEEEMGYKVAPSAVLYVNSHIAASGTSGSRHRMYYAEVNESMRSGAGGGLADHGELIEVLSLPLEQTEPFLLDDTLCKSVGLMFGLLWARNQILEGKLGTVK